MNDIARFAFDSLDISLERQRPLLEKSPHEIPACGPAWSCGEFGRPGHDYYTCPLCHRNFHRWLNREKGSEATA